MLFAKYRIRIDQIIILLKGQSAITKGKIFFLLTLFILGFNCNLFAQQNVSLDIQNINLAMFDAKYLQMEISYQLFFDDAIQSEMQGVVKKSGNMVHQQIGTITIIKKEPYCLFMDSKRKIIVLDPYYPEESGINREDILHLNVDSIKHLILATDTRESGSIKEYTFTLKKGQFSRVILEFNSKNYLLKRIELHQREDYRDNKGNIHAVKMLINFNDINNKAKINESEFDIYSYVDIDTKKKKAFALGAYKSYKFNSNIDKTVKFK